MNKTLEDLIYDTIVKKKEDGTIEKIVSEKIEGTFSDAITSVMSGYDAPVKKLLKDKIALMMTEIIEKKDFSEYMVKLSTLVSSVIENSAIKEHKQIADNLNALLGSELPKYGEEIDLETVFDKYKDYIEEQFKYKTFDDEDVYDDGECKSVEVEVVVGVRLDKKYTWEKGTVVIEFKNDKDDTYNFDMPIRYWDYSSKPRWELDSSLKLDLGKLRNIPSFAIFLESLYQSSTSIISEKYKHDFNYYDDGDEIDSDTLNISLED